VCYIKIQGNKDEIKAIKEMVQNEIKVIKEMVKIDIESMEYLKPFYLFIAIKFYEVDCNIRSSFSV
jgi:hypothetical protein